MNNFVHKVLYIDIQMGFAVSNKNGNWTTKTNETYLEPYAANMNIFAHFLSKSDKFSRVTSSMKFVVAEIPQTQFVQAKFSFFLASESHSLAQLPIEPEIQRFCQTHDIAPELRTQVGTAYPAIVILIH